MEKLEQRIVVELEQWPEHAVLNDVSFLMQILSSYARLDN